MTVTVIATTRPRPGAEAALQAYLDGLAPALNALGVEILARYQARGPVAGDAEGTFVTVLGYPSEEAVRELFEGPAYKAVIPHRDAAFERYDIAIYDAV